ncbi:hypothetical protein EJD97_017831 [Solanum chilense]|uniref:Uncharacterized protein n=1 Tax=Solanum chilense TaxID=4083 RepID=A0A6N2B270_SOLCI|nr:hypothetical protein EJD97_017831 [Solanum chilense]
MAPKKRVKKKSPAIVNRRTSLRMRAEPGPPHSPETHTSDSGGGASASMDSVKRENVESPAIVTESSTGKRRKVKSESSTDQIGSVKRENVESAAIVTGSSTMQLRTLKLEPSSSREIRPVDSKNAIVTQSSTGKLRKVKSEPSSPGQIGSVDSKNARQLRTVKLEPSSPGQIGSIDSKNAIVTGSSTGKLRKVKSEPSDQIESINSKKRKTVDTKRTVKEEDDSSSKLTISEVSPTSGVLTRRGKAKMESETPKKEGNGKTTRAKVTFS